jgi:hypothetical protein
LFLIDYEQRMRYNKAMDGGFTPPQIPQGPVGAPNQAPNQINAPSGFERESQLSRSVARSGKIKQAANAVIKTRADFKAYLQSNGLDLFTSAVEFQQLGDFITSSYVIYRNHGDYQEPLSAFLARYPQLQQAVVEIRDRLRPVQQYMDVKSKSLRDAPPIPGFEGI